MEKIEVSVLIPSRNEEFLSWTVDDLLENTNDCTEIIVTLDGAWSQPPMKQHPRLNVIYLPEAIGQRQAEKIAARLAKGKYLLKVDAHCNFDKDFDLKMLEGFKKTGDNVVMLAIMKNLHCYDWKCRKCGCRTYQDKGSTCPDCGRTDMYKKRVWQGRRGTHATSYCFDSTSHFQYFSDYTIRPEYKKDLEETGFTESMSLQGSFWMLTKDKYFELDIDNDEFGSWGNQGTATACFFWLSGGKVLVNHNTWYSHMFRTKGEVFGFPYPQSGREVQKTKDKIKDLFWNGRFEGQTKNLSWLVEKFSPVPGWSLAELDALKQNEKQRGF